MFRIGQLLSLSTARLTDSEVARLITEAHHQVRTLLAGCRPTLDRLAQKLLEEKTVEGDELVTLITQTRIAVEVRE